MTTTITAALAAYALALALAGDAMSVKMTGKEFKAFYDDPAVWGPRDIEHPTYCDDTVICVDDEEQEDWEIDKIQDDARIKVVCGVLFNRPRGVPESFDGAARWWLKRQTTTTLVIECHKDKLDAVKEAIKATGGKIL